MTKLSQLDIGQEAIIIKIDSKYINRLLSMGLVPGAKIKLIRKAPTDDPLEFEIKGYSLSLRKNTCNTVEVKENVE